MNKIYNEILDFVFLAKKLEYCVLDQFNYEGESVFRGVWDKVIPRKGKVEFGDKEYIFFFHGSGVDFTCGEETLRYNRSVNQGLGIHFTPLIHKEYKENVELVDSEYKKLVELNLIKQWMPEIPMSKVFYLV